MFNTKFLSRNGGQVEQLEAKIASHESDRAVLVRELGTDDPQAIIARVRALEGKLAEASRPSAATTSATGDDGEMIQLSSPGELMEKIRSFNGRIQDLNDTVAGMEAQLIAVYEEKEGMERLVGAGDLDGIMRIIQGYKATISHMEQQLMGMYAARETLQSQMGTSDAHRIVELFRNVSSLVSQIQEQMTVVEIAQAPPAPQPVTGINIDLPRVTPALYEVSSVQKKVATVPSEGSTTRAVVTPAPMPTAAVMVAPVIAEPPAAALPVATPTAAPVRPVTPATPVTAPISSADAPRSVSPAVAAAAAAFASAAVVSAASVAAISKSPAAAATGRGQLPPDDPNYDPLSNPNDPMNDDSLINGTP